MKTKFYILDIYSQLEKHKVRETNNFVTFASHSAILNSDEQKKTSLVLSANSFQCCLFLIELKCCPNYRSNVMHRLNGTTQPVIIMLQPNPKEIIDDLWGARVIRLIWEKIEIEHMLSWLSTLGGAFSALGDYSTNRASIAGKISLKQMALALRIGDPFIVVRCMLFLSIALMQRGHLRSAKHVIRSQYQFAKQHIDYDSKLVNMCLGIQAKLQYLYYLRSVRKTKALLRDGPQ